MACFENKESKSDLEVRNLIYQNDVSQESESKPLSPILGGCSINRRFIHGRRLRGRKSRIKLSDRFKENEDSPESTPVKNDFPQLTEDSFTPSQSENIVKQIERLEEIEDNRNKIYSMIVGKNKENEFSFKKPVSPSLNKAKKAKMVSKIDIDAIESEDSQAKVEECIVSNPAPLPSGCTGFQTAKGKSIEVSESDIKKHSKLFEDIMFNPGKSCDSRKNKYSFLSKTKSEVRFNGTFKFDIKLASSENDVSTNPKKHEEQTKFDPYIVVEGLKHESIPVNPVSERNDIVSTQTFRTSDVSLTQQISESGISNTQMVRAADEALTSMGTDESFRGFYKEEVMVYENIFERFINIYKELQNHHRKCSKRSIFSMTGNSGQSAVQDRESDNIVTAGKRTTDDLPLPPTKRIKSNDSLVSVQLHTENKENKGCCGSNLNFCGFTSASGKNITVSEHSLKKARRLFDDVDDTLPKKLTEVQSKTSILDINNTSDVPHMPYKQVRGHFVPEPQNETNEPKSIPLRSITTLQSPISRVNNNSNVSNSGFVSGSGKHIIVSDNSLNKAKCVFDDLDKGLPVRNVVSKTSLHGFNVCNNAQLGGFSSASGKLLTVSDTALKNARNVFENLDVEPLREVQSKPNMPVSHSCQRLSRSRMGILEPIPETSESDEATPSKKPERFPHTVSRVQATAPRTPKNIFADFDLSDIMPLRNTNLPIKASFQPVKSFTTPRVSLQQRLEKHVEQTVQKNSIPPKIEDTKPKKRLGISACKLLPISSSNLERARMIFEEDLPKLSPLKPAQNNVYMSTPVRQNISSASSKVDVRPITSPMVSCSTPVRCDSAKPMKSFSSFMENSAITPIKPNVTGNRIACLPSIPDQQVVITSPTKGNALDWMNRLRDDRTKLEEKLTVILGRMKMMEVVVGEKSEDDKRPREGVLFRNKATSHRISLEFFVDNKRPGEESVNYELFEINPENAEYVHFKDQTYAAMSTEDGAVVIPNFQDVVGLSEITSAFNMMPGVDPDLIPKGWVRNHYKWIIWKLTSYARMYPVRFGNCLNVENVVQQLKYRYDREVDKAERSALRRIYEKDDAPQKRLILCVSDIKEVNPNRYELELTDGWYGIRTVIDDSLNNQVTKQKIQIGTKLLISGAELLHCDGCYPLETTPLTCLKINFNCTRRARWNCRLGYQRNPQPFLIPIHSIHPLGGAIGAIKVCIVRTYPFKYLEKAEGRSVWRNKKAEERRAQHWENERHKKLETIRDTVIREFEIAHLKKKLRSEKSHGTDSRASSPSLIYQPSNADGSDRLSPTKIDYRDKLSARMQQEIAERIKDHVDKVRLPKRDVTEVLRLLVVDTNGSSDKGFNFFVWRPGDTYLQMLREGTVVTVYNVLPRKNGDLNTCTKTTFKHEPPAPHLYNCFKRRLSEIGEFTRSSFLPAFEEFDTVGLVIQLKVEVSDQEVWLADRFGRLLLIRVYEGPSTCLLLDSVKRGQVTTVCNLRYRGSTEGVLNALANYFTVFSCYSQHRHLQEGLEIFRKQLPKDVSGILSDCDRKIGHFKTKHFHSRNSFSSILEDDDESTLISSRLTSTDVALSLIDMDRYT